MAISLPRRSILRGLASLPLAAQTKVRHSIYRSADRGRTWTPSSRGFDGVARVNGLASLDGGVIAAGTDRGILVSRDRGISWSTAAIGGVGGSSRKILAILAHLSRAFAATENGLLRSEDGGATWHELRGLPAGKVLSLASARGRFQAGTDGNGVLESSDGGLSWRQIGAGLPAHSQVFELAATGSDLFAALYSRGLYRWDERERTWKRSGNVTPLAAVPGFDTIVAGHNPGGLFWSADRGATWTKSQTPGSSVNSHEPVWKMAAGGGLVLAGVGDGTYVSMDGGRTFTRAGGGWPGASPGIAFLVEKDVVLGAMIRAAIE